jgi:hypothetical protein
MLSSHGLIHIHVLSYYSCSYATKRLWKIDDWLTSPKASYGGFGHQFVTSYTIVPLQFRHLLGEYFSFFIFAF